MFVVGLASIVLLGILCLASVQPGAGSHYGVPAPAASIDLGSHSTPQVPRAAQVVPATGFPRTVLVETFTGVWCIHCPAESQALHILDLSNNESVLTIAELHVCAFPPGQGPCLENYVPSDSTSDGRGTFYGVQGYPDVIFDGTYSVYGASNSESQMQGEYSQSIANASAVPGNVSISEDATVSSGIVNGHVNVTSAVTGTFNAVSYLTEYIDKLNVSNGYGPHDVDHVVRETLHNHPVSLVAGTSTEFDIQGPLNASWNDRNLSVITFIQQNSTKIVENANMAPVTTLTTAVSAGQNTLASGAQTSITVQVANSTTGAPISGATVDLTSSGGGSFAPASGVTLSDGTLTSTLHAPVVAAETTLVISASVNAANYTAGLGFTTVDITPGVAPLAPTGLTIGAGNLQASLNWTTPVSGGGGLVYHVFRSTSAGGTYTEIGSSTATNYSDSDLVGGHTYWYTVSAQNTYGFSSNSSAEVATGVTVTTHGLPAGVGWWFAVDAANFSAPLGGPVALYLPAGTLPYEVGAESYAYVLVGSPDPLVVSGAPLTVTASFEPRYASLHGTVDPASATVTLDGAPVDVVSGSFALLLAAGTYTLNVTAAGYQSNVSQVTLTPGNLTTLTVSLNHVSFVSGPSTFSVGGLSGMDSILLIVGVIAAVAVIATTVLLIRKGKSRQSPPAGKSGAASPPRAPRKGP